jgi:hypothetical protein
VILNKPSPEHKVEDQEFEPNEVYAIDIVVSSGEETMLCTTCSSSSRRRQAQKAGRSTGR